MGATHTMDTQNISGLQVDAGVFIDLPGVYTKADALPVSNKHIRKESDHKRWPHVEGLAIPTIDAGVGLLIGNNVPGACTSLDLIWNLIRDQPALAMDVFRIEVTELHRFEEYRQLEQMYHKDISLDFLQRTIDDDRMASQEDLQFLEKVTNSQKVQDGHYEIEIPFRNV